MKLAVARMVGRQPRFFTGGYVEPLGGAALPMRSPITTGQPDEARVYDDRVVAQLVCGFLNLLAGIRSASLAKPWIVVELPEEWL